MGRKSTKNNKTRYQLSREAKGLTREKASEMIGFLSDDRIERIESEISPPHPDEVLAMSKVYDDSILCNYYCSNVCPIGKKYVPELRQSGFVEITMRLLNNFNIIETQKNRIIELAVDGKITEDEKNDFDKICNTLNEISILTQQLTLWVNDMENINDEKKIKL